MKPHKHCELIKAWADGAEIQRRKFASDEWVDTDPDWQVGTEYRIKPRTVKREGWAVIFKYNDGTPYLKSKIFASEYDAKRNSRMEKAIIKVEWEEEVE